MGQMILGAYPKHSGTLSCFQAPLVVLRSLSHIAVRKRALTSLQCSANPPASSSMPSPVAVLGAGGNMASSIITGLAARPDCPTIRASSRSQSSLSHLPIPSTLKFTSNLLACQSASVILLSVKPQIAPAVLKEISPVFEDNPDPPTLLSVVGGLSTDTILKHIAAPAPIIRAMPNTPAKYNAAITAICPGLHASESHVSAARSIMQAVGAVVELPEYQIPAFTAVAGAGVAYVFLFAEAMAHAAVAKGLPRKTAMEVVAQTVKGAGFCLEGGVHPAVLRNEVESPGGITIAGTGALEKGGLRGNVWQAVEEVVKRDAEIGKGA